MLLENVKNLAKHNNCKTINKILRVLDNLGYTSFFEVLNASYYGVPQARERLFIVSFRKYLNVKSFDFPKPYYDTISIKDIIEPDEKTKEYSIKRTDIIIKNNLTEHNDFFDKTMLKPLKIGIINKGGQGERIYAENGHAITLSAYGGGAAGKTGAYLINGKIRQLSPRECLRCLGFPEWFFFPKEISKNQAHKQCGNSVVMPVVKAIFKNILKKGVL